MKIDDPRSTSFQSKESTIFRKCSFKDCDNKILAKKLCTGHYQQMYHGKELTSLKANTSEPVVDGKRKCATCGKSKAVKDFYTRENNHLTADCKTCYIKKVRARKN